MTKDKDEKAVIRARMARTGESYAAARAQLARDQVGASTGAEGVSTTESISVRLTQPAERAFAAVRRSRGTAWQIVVALRETDGIAGRVLAELSMPRVSWDEFRALGRGDDTGSQPASWSSALAAATRLARDEGRPLVDSGLLLRGAVSVLTDEEVPSTDLLIASGLRAADLAKHCAAAEQEQGPEDTPKNADGSERTGMFERFTDKARQVVVKAQEEARALEHNWIGTEHVLLGLLSVQDAVAAKALTSLGVPLDETRARVEEIIGRGEEPPASHIPFTPRAKKVLEHSLRAALEMNHNYIGTEHLLLGLLAEPDGVACQVLVEREGVTVESVRAKVLELLEQHRKQAEDEG